MTSNRPYLIRALYEWITDNGLTAHLLVNAELAEVDVPREYVHEGRIVLNVSPLAVQGLRLDNESIGFSARFGGGTPRSISLPPRAVMAIYARENGQGMVFSNEPDHEPSSPSQSKPLRKPSLKVVK